MWSSKVMGRWVILKRTGFFLWIMLLISMKCEYTRWKNTKTSPPDPSHMCDYVCVSLRHRVRQKEKKCWKPTKPEGVIGLSTWIFDWRRIKNSMKGNSKNKRGKTSHDRSRQTGKAREDGKKEGINNGSHFNDYCGFLRQISRREITLIFCRL